MRTKISLISFNLKNLNKNLLKKFKSKGKHRLIGNWCRDHKFLDENSLDLSAFNFKNWKNKKGQLKDIKKINTIYKKLLKEFVNNLNIIHNKNYPKKYWEFLINRWLLANIIDLFSKWKISDKIIERFNVSNFYYLKLNEKSFIPENTWHHNVLHKSNDGLWSHIIFRNIFNYRTIGLKNIEINSRAKLLESSLQKRNFVKYNIKSFFNFFLFDKIFMYDLSFDKKIVFFIKLKNFFANINFKREKVDLSLNSLNLRSEFVKLFKSKQKSLENFIKESITITFPKIFLENYTSLEKVYSGLNWIKKPKFIMTSYGHYYDEVFKIYCSKNIIKNSKIFIFQHGDGGIYDYDDYYSTGWDKILCDKYFVWGKNPKKNYKKFYFTKKKIDSKIYFKNNFNGKILITMYGFSEQPYRPLNGHYDFYDINRDLFKNNIKFFKNLKNEIKAKINIKILDNSRKKIVNNSLKKLYTNKRVINEKENYLKIINNYNLIVHFYLGTPFFESMFYNKPSIIILNEKFQLHFDKNFRVLVKKFKKNRICFESPVEASKFINDNFKDLEDWWNDSKVQRVRKKFCDLYCRNFELGEDFNNLFKK